MISLHLIPITLLVAYFDHVLHGVSYHTDDDDVGNEDSDVATERRRVESGQAYGETVVLYDLTKTYPNCMAVDRVSVGVPENECFGLLGLNGAGKTTTFKLLTGDVLLTSGDAFVLNNSVTTDISKVCFDNILGGILFIA